LIKLPYLTVCGVVRRSGGAEVRKAQISANLGAQHSANFFYLSFLLFAVGVQIDEADYEMANIRPQIPKLKLNDGTSIPMVSFIIIIVTTHRKTLTLLRSLAMVPVPHGTNWEMRTKSIRL